MIDELIAKLEREVEIEPTNINAVSQLVSLKLRKGEKYPIGAIIEIDTKLWPATQYWSYKSFWPPKSLKGRWVVEHVYIRNKKPETVRMIRLGKHGQKLSDTVPKNVSVMGVALLSMMTKSISAPGNSKSIESIYKKADPESLTLREHSAYGHCLTLGKIVSETERSYLIDDGERNMRRKKKRTLHYYPCKHCSDNKYN